MAILWSPGAGWESPGSYQPLLIPASLAVMLLALDCCLSSGVDVWKPLEKHRWVQCRNEGDERGLGRIPYLQTCPTG